MGIQRRTATAEDYTPDAEPTDDPVERNGVVSRRRGWGAAEETMKRASSGYASDFKITDSEQLIKFLEDEPFYSVGLHWVDEITQGKRSFYCLADNGEDCPLCELGDSPRAQSLFNVVPLSDENGATEPEVKVLAAGPMLTRLIRKQNDSRGGPLSRHYWTISKSGGGPKGGKVNYNMGVVKEADLAADFAVDPAKTHEALDKVKPYDENVVKFTSRDDLEKVIEEHNLV